MGCCNHKQKFSYITKQDEMTDHLIKEKERIKEDLAELEKRHLLSITDSLTVKSNSELEKQMKLISEVSEEKQKRKSLNEFIKGLDEIEIEKLEVNHRNKSLLVTQVPASHSLN